MSKSLIIVSKTMALNKLLEIPILPLKKGCTVYLCIRDYRKKPKNPKTPEISEKSTTPTMGFYIARNVGRGEKGLERGTVPDNDIVFIIKDCGRYVWKNSIKSLRYERVKSSQQQADNWLAKIKERLEV
jgi:hypothetical protein